MVRFYNRKTYHGTITENIMEKAIEEMNDWTSIQLKSIQCFTQLFSDIFRDTETILV
jgi:hypothetical protein